MKKRLNRHSAFIFKHFKRKGYALFAVWGKVVLIGVLNVATLTFAKADDVGIDVVDVVDEDVVDENEDDDVDGNGNDDEDENPSHHSNSAEDEEGFGEQLVDEVVIIGSRAPMAALQSVKMVSVISREDIHRAEVHTINDILKLVVGVDVRQRGGFGVQTDISINGGTFDQIAILLNGMPLSSPQTGHNAADFPVSLSDIERIEVLEGASARVFGTSAFSGAINIVTRCEDGRGARVSLEGGSFGTFGGDGSVRLSSAQVNHSLSAGYARSDGGTDNSDFRQRRAYYQGSHRSTIIDLRWQGGLTSRDFGANTFYSSKFPDQYEETRRVMGSVMADIRPFVESGSRVASSCVISPSLYAHRDYDHYQLIRGREGAQAGENYHRMDVYGGCINTHFAWAAGKTAVGADIRREHILSTAYGELLEESIWMSIHGTNRMYNHEGERTNTSLFLEHNLMLDCLNLSAGILANRNTGLDKEFHFYPGIDISYRPDEHWKLYAGWNKALRVPTYTDLYTSNAAQQGDLHLKPERNTTYKAGADYNNLFASARISAFYSRGTNLIDWVYETEASTKYHALNIGQLDNMGFSAELTCNFSQMFGAKPSDDTPVTSLRLAYAFIHQKHDMERPIYRSLYALEYVRHKLVAEFTHPIYGHPSKGLLSASWALRRQQRMNGFPPYTKIDGKLMWTMRKTKTKTLTKTGTGTLTKTGTGTLTKTKTTPSWQLFLKGDNLTNQRYYDVGAVLQPGLWIMAGISVKTG
jgi:iron complex outermembrane receptor protein